MKQKPIAKKVSQQLVPEVSRCAVCKIDLKGRFVYVDKFAQKLLGYSDVDLFGKPISSVVEESQRPVLSKLTSTPNHYESFFESTTLTIVNSSGEHIQVTVILSLNFIAGSPANYQLIISELPSHNPAQEKVDTKSNSAGDYLQRIASLSSKIEWSQVISLICELSAAQIVVIYVVAGKKFTPIKAFSPSMTEEDALRRVPKAKGLLKRVIQSGEFYDFTNEKSVREAIEADSSAPNELVMPVVLSESEKYLVRLIFDADDTDLHLNANTKASLALMEVVTRLAGSGRAKSKTTESEHICSLLIDAIEELSPGFISNWSQQRKSGQDLS